MESITIKVPEEMAKEIDSYLRPDYGTRTEFIRDAIRKKLESVRLQKLVELNFGKFKGKAKYSDREAREIISKELLTKYKLE